MRRFVRGATVAGLTALAGFTLHRQVALGAAALGSRVSDTALSNDNRTPAGTLAGGVLTLGLDAREVTWWPEAEGGTGIPVYAFAESGRATIPAPLIRVPVATQIAATIRNTLPKPLRVFGLHARGAPPDSLIIPAGDTAHVRFAADVSGTYFYYGRTEAVPPAPGPGIGRDATLFGAFVVDSSAGTSAPKDRIFVLTGFYDSIPGVAPWTDQQHRILSREFIRRDLWALTGVNGKSWPHTERLSYNEGDTIRWRIISAGPFPHPMHLHGFHFRVEARGSLRRDTVYAVGARREVVTEVLNRGTTMTMSWVADRPGNWLFHCHLVTHIADVLRLPSPSVKIDHLHGNHAENGMAGLVMGIRVHPARPVVLASSGVPRRRLRLFVTEKPNLDGDLPVLSYVLQEGSKAPARDSIRAPSSTLMLQQQEPTEIAVINLSKQATTVHWHGLELESYYDGVGDWSGWGQRLAPAIAPGDSFVVRLTPPRAGTFIYHTHMDEGVQLASGLFGALIVRPRGTPIDTTERLVLIGMSGASESAGPSINGSTAPAPIELRAGVPHRLRIINISPSEPRGVELLAGETPLTWRAVAKDGAALPLHLATTQSARRQVAAGETYDFEVLRQRPETLTLRVVGSMSVAARKAFRAEADAGDRSPRLILNVPVIVR